MNLTHKCSFKGVNSKVSSEYLAEKYFEEWRENPGWELDKFVKNIAKTLGVKISYHQAWSTRVRARFMINGDGAEEYGRLWEYANALRTYNPGSTVIVVVDNVENPPLIFKRMYVCFKACKVGFLAGCRPLIGVDGCHLKGSYPGMILFAVSMDANNNIYHVAWAVVEVENNQSRTWFLTLLMENLEKVDGLLEALNRVTPKAEIRFYVRHIWANFKLQWPGGFFKESFWKTARTTSLVEFKRELAGIKYLNADAYTYLNAIPPKH
ncbi:uncharacterized protein LOC141601862 [Silene latifolia]|uniref:uncharacterized protein LOC141601862 n=1 Tax=Silene latifolia TaxID=37657 RepID=UPI003D77A817